MNIIERLLKKNPNAVRAANANPAIEEACDLSGVKTLTDVGGGLGVLMTALLRVHPSMKGIIADIPLVVSKTKDIIRSKGLAERCKAVACDFLKSIPSGSNAYLMANILHDWTDEHCRTILKNCKKAMNPGSKLLIIEMVIPPGNQPSIAKLLDLEMHVTTGGRERTEDEFETLLNSAGFQHKRTTPTKAGASIIESIR